MKYNSDGLSKGSNIFVLFKKREKEEEEDEKGPLNLTNLGRSLFAKK